MKAKILTDQPTLRAEAFALKQHQQQQQQPHVGNCKNSSSIRKERNSYKFSAKYDGFQGILKRVSDMQLNGSLDSIEPRNEFETSENRTCPLRNSTVEEYSSPSDDGRPRGFAQEVDTCEGLVNQSSRMTSADANDGCPIDLSVGNVSTSEVHLRTGDGPRARTSSGQGSTHQQDVNDNRMDIRKCVRPDDENGLGVIAESEKHQLEMFFKSLKTDVFVCESLANLYVSRQEDGDNWTYRHTGVVVVILDCGDTKSKRKRKIQILLAERGTCFPLWKDTIDNLSSYHKSNTSSSFHTMHLSSDHRQIIGFSFDSPAEAEKLLAHIDDLTSNPENINISVPGSRKKVKTTKKCFPLPHKMQISNPCLFQHVISVAAKDKPIYVSLQTLTSTDAMENVENAS